MKRALAKGTVLFAFGRLPGGAKAYRHLTRKWMGTQASHVDKLARVWPGYIKVWQQHCNMDLEGKQLWVHEGGYTLFPFLAGYLITGKGPIVTNAEGSLSDQYVDRSIEAALAFEVGDSQEAQQRKDRLKKLAETNRTALEWVDTLRAKYLEIADPASIPMPSESVDIVHSGGVLEHYEPAKLDRFNLEVQRILNKGGVSSHIVDHRDHLYHADKKIYFLNHLKYSNLLYSLLFGHHLTYHNRLSSGSVSNSFSHAGLEKIKVRRLTLPDSNYCDTDEETIASGLLGLPRAAMHSQFEYSEADLHTAAAHYLFKKQE